MAFLSIFTVCKITGFGSFQYTKEQFTGIYCLKNTVVPDQLKKPADQGPQRLFNPIENKCVVTTGMLQIDRITIAEECKT